MIEYLRVKIKSLASEARIIRQEELQFPKGQRDNATYHGLHAHRTGIVRDEARASLLAYGYLRGMPYLRMEAKCYLEPDWAKVLKIASRFSTVDPDVFKLWYKGESEPVVKQAA